MQKTKTDLFVYLASYAPWGQENYAHTLFRLFGEDLSPQRYDGRDPPRRNYTGDAHDVQFWTAKGEQEWGRWLFCRRKANDHDYHAVIHWIDRTKEPMKSRGDYHSMYLTVKTTNPLRVMDFWRSACVELHSFHGFLDTGEQCNGRAHEVGDDGQIIRKLTGWYLQRLPGFFAYNYFGSVYLRRWGEELLGRLPAGCIDRVTNGMFIVAPSGLGVKGQSVEVYPPDDLAIIQTLGPEWFHLPTQPDQVHAPSLEEFLATTPHLS